MNTRKTLARWMPLMAVAATLALAGCKGEKQADNRTGFERSLTAKDTADVTKLVDTFFKYVEGGDAAQAASMLCQFPDSDVHAEPLPLPDSLLGRTELMLDALPVIAHRIEYIKFGETYANEVKVTAILAHAEGDMPEVSTAFYFRPYDYLGAWRLCMVDTNTGAAPMLSGSEKDSVVREAMREDSIPD